MDGINELGTFISSVGFPIAASVGIFYLYNKTIKELTVTLEKIGDGVQQLLDRGNKNGND
jgi:hypothetical protein